MEENDFIEKLRENGNKCRNMYELCLKLGINSIGGETYREIRSIAEENNITLVFNGLSKKITQKKQEKKLEELLCEDSIITSNKLKIKIIENGLKPHRCECCGNTEWNGKPIPLELHHKNGKHNDNRIENLQLLCPNCHAQTDNYCGKNTSNKKKLRKIVKINKTTGNLSYVNKQYLINLLYLHSIKEVAKQLEINEHRLKYWLKKLEIHVSNQWREDLHRNNPEIFGICEYCKKRFIKKTSKQKFCNQECSNLSNRKTEITKEKLIHSLKENKSFVQTGKMFGVSDKCIIKWCIRFDIPNRKKEMIEYIKNI